MEQFRHIGEVLGSLRALMVLQDDIQINQRQCCVLLDMFGLAFNTIGEHIRQNLKLEEKNTKWKVLDHPLRELYRVFKDGELYIKHCLDFKDWWGKAISLHFNNDCVEFHVHNLLSHFPAIIEAIENAGEISGLDPEEMQKRRLVLARKYDKEWNDPVLFQWKFGTEYLVPHDMCKRLENAWREDRWILIESILKKKSLGSVVMTDNEQHLADLLLNKLLEPHNKIFPSRILTEGKDYQVRHGGSEEYKEIQWLGENFGMRHFSAEVTEDQNSEISKLLSLSHPNILQYLCGFCDEERNEYLLVMESMHKDLATHMRENSSPMRRSMFSIPVIVDLLLQVARGMEYLHSHKIYHGDLNPSNIILKPGSSSKGYFYAKINGFGLPPLNNHISKNSINQNGAKPFIWYAPEVLADQEETGCNSSSKYSEKADTYSFGMLCFQLLTGKAPFEDDHLQGDEICRNIRAGERPLFPSASPKYLVSLTKRCWQTNAAQRPTFLSICRILRYIKKFLVLNPDNGHPELLLPPIDYCDVDTLLNKFLEEQSSDIVPVTQIPFQIFAYSLVEKEKAYTGFKDKRWDWVSDANSISPWRDDIPAVQEDPSTTVADCTFVPAGETRSVCSAFQIPSDARSVCSEAPIKKTTSLKKIAESKAKKSPGLPRTQSLRQSTLGSRGRNLRSDQGGRLSPVTSGTRRTSARHLQGLSMS